MVGSMFVAMTLAIAQTAPVPALQGGEILLEVSAEGEAKGIPDIAEFSTGVTSDGGTARAALAANAAVAQRLVAAIELSGIAARDVRTSSVSVRPRFRVEKNGEDSQAILGYRASNQLTVTVRDVAKAPALVDALTAAGATDLDGPSFRFADDVPLTARARGAAVAAARREAADYAAALGMRVGRVLRVSERAARSDGGSDIVVTGSRVAAPIRPGEQAVTVTVWIDFALTR